MTSHPFDSVDSIIDYLREETPTVISSPLERKLTPTMRKKGKEKSNLMTTTTNNTTKSSPYVKENIEVLSSGRVKYGPITVNPRKQPSKTLFTGRRSKNEILHGEEEEKRRQRRERNRIAATKCREKRESVLLQLERAYEEEMKRNEILSKTIDNFTQRKEYLQKFLSDHSTLCPPSSTTGEVFGDSTFHSSNNEQPPHSRVDESFPQLTNSTYSSNHPEPMILLSDQHTITMTSSSLDRLINSFPSPIGFVDQTSMSGLINSAYGTSTCAQQYSSSSEEESFPSIQNQHFVY